MVSRIREEAAQGSDYVGARMEPARPTGLCDQVGVARGSFAALGRQGVARLQEQSGWNRIRMPHRITRDRMVEVIRELPADASVDDAIERLVFLAKIEEGLAQLDRGDGIPHDEVKRRLGL